MFYLYHMLIAAVFLILSALCAHRTGKQRYFFLTDFSSAYLIISICELLGMGNYSLYMVAIFNCFAVMIDIIFCNVLMRTGNSQTETFVYNCMSHHGCIGVVAGLLAIGINLL